MNWAFHIGNLWRSFSTTAGVINDAPRLTNWAISGMSGAYHVSRLGQQEMNGYWPDGLVRNNVIVMNGNEESPANGHEPVEIPIDGVLDLHSFRPRDVKDIVNDYLDECRKRGICEVRIVHGKGIGSLKRTVHVLLSRHPAVIDYHLDSTLFSGDGATIVHLRREEIAEHAEGECNQSGLQPLD